MIHTSAARALTPASRCSRSAYPRHQPRINSNLHPRTPTTSPSVILRRGHATKPQPPTSGQGANAPTPTAPPTATSSATTIPGPSWLWLEPVIEPFRAYGRVQQRKPYITQLVSSLVIYFVGDLVAQGIAPPVETIPHSAGKGEGRNEGAGSGEEEDDDDGRGWVQRWSEERDWARTGRALVIGGISSIPSYKWFVWLSMSFNYKSKVLSLTTKVVVNQLLFTPIFNSYFFGMQTLLAGASLDEIVERIKHTVPTSWINSCKLWPAVTAFSFTYIPIQYRSIFGGVIAIGWQTYLSLLNQRAEKMEMGEHEGDVKQVKDVVVVQQGRERGAERGKCVV